MSAERDMSGEPSGSPDSPVGEDQVLIQLVQEKTPDELTADEVTRLQRALRSSPALRTVLLEQLQFETYLNAALGRYEVSVEQILASATATPLQRTSWFWGWPLVLFLALGLLTGGVVVWNLPGPQQPAVIAQRDEEPAAESDSPSAAEALESAKATTAQAATQTAEVVAQTAQPDPPTGQPASTPGPAVAVGAPGTTAVQMPPLPEALWRKEFESEQFARGNVRIDTQNMGKEIGVIYSDDPQPAFVEYEITAPQAGKYRVEMRYASKSTRPLKLLVNDQLALGNLCRSTTKDWKPQHQAWFPLGEIELQQGANRVRFEADPPAKQARKGQFPAIDKWALTSSVPVTVPIPPTESARPDQPWQELVRVDQAPVSAVTGSFGEHGELWGLRRPRFTQWFEPVPNVPHQIHETQYGEVAVVGYEGLLKLRAPWVEGAILRLSAFDHFGMRLHFWSGQQGITLQFSDRPSPWWGAYATTRTDAEPRPKTFVLINSDEGRYDRSAPGPFEVRHQAGTLVLSRGDVRLLTVACPEPPREVYLDGRGWLRGVTMYRGEALAEVALPARPLILRTDEPAQLTHTSHLPTGAELKPLADGRLQLLSEKTKDLARATWSLDTPGLYEVLFQIEQATPGTGVFLSDLQGQPVHRVGFFKERQTQATCLGFLRPNENHDEAHYDPQHQIVPFTGEVSWVRLILGQGSLKCWVSGDGKHWGRAMEPLRSVRGGFKEFGIYCLPGDRPRQLTLRRVEVRELQGLTGIVPQELLARAPVLTGDIPPEAWLQHVVESQPPTLDAAQWRQACALRTLSQGTGQELGRMLLMGLMADVVVRKVSPEDRLRFIADAALWADAWEHHEGQQFANIYETLALTLLDEGHTQANEIATTGLLNAPLWTTLAVRTTGDAPVRQQLTQLIYQEDWEQVADFVRWVRFWNRNTHPHQPPFQHREGIRQLVDLADAWALRSQGKTPSAVPNDQRSGSAAWRHPLIEQLSKEGYNVLAELEAALAGQAYRDACQIIMSAPSQGGTGLLPDTKDPRLYVSLPRAVQLAMREHPPLQETMESQFAPIGRLRVRQGMAENNMPAVQTAAVQFTGTEAAAEAGAWLGDRALTAGQFVQAAGMYQQALPLAGIALQQQLQARLDLVHALSGQLTTAPQPPEVPVKLGEKTLSPADFAQLIQDLQTQRQGTPGSGPAIQPGHQIPQAIPPSSWKLGRRFAFEGDTGQNPGAQRVSQADVTGREFSLVVAEPWLLMSNRFQVAAYDLASGMLKWRTGVGSIAGDARSWSGTPFTPVIHQGRVYVRRLTQPGIELACLELATGKLLWTKRPSTHVISDPLLIQDDLFALCVEEPQFGLVHVSLVNFSVTTGEVQSQTLITPLRDAWATKVPCEAVVAGDQIVAALGGCVFSCDVLGQVRWLRRQNWFPPSDELGFLRQYRNIPVVQGNRVYLTQPGVCAVEALELETGRLIWQRAWGDLRRIIGWNANQVIVETGTQWIACQADNGQINWTKPWTTPLEGAWCPAEGSLIACRTQWLQKDQNRLQFVWLDPASGMEQGRWTCPDLIEQEPQIGPLVGAGDRLWLIHGKQTQEATREIVELVPTGAAVAGAQVDLELQNWTSHVHQEVRTLTREHMPGWTFLTSLSPGNVAYQPTVGTEQDVLRTQSDRSRSVVWLRRVAIPAGKTRLRFNAGVDPMQSGQFIVKVNEQTTWQFPLESLRPERWVQQEIDLAAFAGQTVWLQVAFDPTSDGPVNAQWKELSLAE